MILGKVRKLPLHSLAVLHTTMADQALVIQVEPQLHVSSPLSSINCTPPSLILPIQSAATLFMAPRLLLLLLLLLFVLRRSGSDMFVNTENAAGSSSPISRSELTGGSVDCGGLCGERCKLSSRPRLCGRACGTCCGRCNCVPAGTSGNYEACPCYANLTTHGGRRKCP